ncbi:MAG: hypothetical protein IPM54_16125 [Polyangiaceae bacterium]|nr:hypothetical protein [Polyangiaceae bacterium]
MSPIRPPAKLGRTTPAAVILAAGPNGLGAARSLARARIPTIAVAIDPAEPILWSRLPAETLLIETDLATDDALMRSLESLGDARHVLLPTSDKFVSFVMRNEATLSQWFEVCVPPPRLGEALIDKAAETKLIADIGLPLPKTLAPLPDDPRDLVDALGLPILVKPTSFRANHVIGKNRLLQSDAHVASLYEDTHGQRAHFLAQEVIPGPDDHLWVCNCTFDAQSELVAAFTFRRLRLSPSHFGVTSYAISERNLEVVQLVRRLGRELRYVGPAMVEFKRDPRDGVYKYIELNPRLGMCNAFDSACGVNNALAAFHVARGEAPPARAMGSQREGVIYASLFDDVYHRLKDGERAADVLRDYVAGARRPHVFAYFAWRDPAPGLVMGYRNARSLSRSVALRAGGSPSNPP